MTEPAPSPSPAPSPAPAPSPEPSPSPAPATATRPEWLPENFWDPKANALNTDEFGKHYVETAANAAKFAERVAAVPKDEAGYKVEIKLPPEVKIPEGVTFDPSKDPRLPTLLKTAREIGLSNDDVNKLVALDAQFAIANHAAEQARIGEETKKLGDKANDRIAAVTNWAKGLKEKGDLTADEFAEIRMTATTAAGVTALEKLMAKASGGIPGHVPNRDPPPPPQPITDRWYGNQQKVS